MNHCYLSDRYRTTAIQVLSAPHRSHRHLCCPFPCHFVSFSQRCHHFCTIEMIKYKYLFSLLPTAKILNRCNNDLLSILDLKKDSLVNRTILFHLKSYTKTLHRLPGKKFLFSIPLFGFLLAECPVKLEKDEYSS